MVKALNWDKAPIIMVFLWVLSKLVVLEADIECLP